MHRMIRLFFLLSLSLALAPLAPGQGTPDRELSRRLRQAELIFNYRFTEEAIKAQFRRAYDPVINEIAAKGGQDDILAKIDAIFAEYARDIVASESFREGYVTWLATDFSMDELRELYAWIQTSLGTKVLLFESKAGALLAETARGRDHGRREEIQHLIYSARQNQRTPAPAQPPLPADEESPHHARPRINPPPPPPLELPKIR